MRHKKKPIPGKEVKEINRYDEDVIDSLKEDYTKLFNEASLANDFALYIEEQTRYRSKTIASNIKKAKFLEYFKGGKVLDIGSLDGYHIDWFDGAEKIYCVDIIDNFFELIKTNHSEKNIECKLTKGSELSFIEDNYLDFIFSMDSIVRLTENQYKSYFNEFERVLKPGGVAYIHLPIEFGRMHSKYLNDRPHIFTKNSLKEAIVPWGSVEFADGYVSFGSIAIINKHLDYTEENN